MGLIWGSSQHGDLLHQSKQTRTRGRKRMKTRQKSQLQWLYDRSYIPSSHHFGHILFIRSKPLISAHTKGKVLYKDVNTRRRGSLAIFQKLPTTESMGSILVRVPAKAAATPALKVRKYRNSRSNDNGNVVQRNYFLVCDSGYHFWLSSFQAWFFGLLKNSVRCYRSLNNFFSST